MCRANFLSVAVALVLACASALSVAEAAPRKSVALHGDPLLPDDFTALHYVNPDAPKGGRLTLGVLGSFDSVNPFIVKGAPSAGVREFGVEALMARGLDEPFTLYGLIAETIDIADDGLSVTFALNPKARFSDGTTIVPDDVIKAFTLLKEKGRPNHRTYFAKVTKAETIGAHGVRFTFVDASDDDAVDRLRSL
jgi:peptide/nickel transport system substrate-binding protein